LDVRSNRNGGLQDRQDTRWLGPVHANNRLALAARRAERKEYDDHVVWPQTRYLPLKTRCAIDALVAAIPPMISG